MTALAKSSNYIEIYPEFWNVQTISIIRLMVQYSVNGTHNIAIETLLNNWFGRQLPNITQNIQLLLWLNNFRNVKENSQEIIAQALFETIEHKGNGFSDYLNDLPCVFKTMGEKAIKDIICQINPNEK